MENKGYEHHIPKNSNISITSSLFIYKVLKGTEQDFETPGTFEENDRTFVVLDEIYRPGHDVKIKKQFYFNELFFTVLINNWCLVPASPPQCLPP